MLDKVKVGGLEYQINIKEHLESYDGDRNLWGYCNYEQNEIDISKSLSSQKANQVLAHELTHAILFEAGYIDHDEEMAHRIGLVLHQVLKDNDFSWLNKS